MDVNRGGVKWVAALHGNAERRLVRSQRCVCKSDRRRIDVGRFRIFFIVQCSEQ